MEKSMFDTNFEKFERRKPTKRLGDKIDTTHMRFVDVAKKEEILQEYELIKKKKSILSASERKIITEMITG